MRARKGKNAGLDPIVDAKAYTAALIRNAKAQVTPSPADRALIDEIHHYGASEIARAFARLEERIIYLPDEAPTKEVIDDTWLLRMVVGLIQKLPAQAHLREKVRVIQLKAS